MSKIKFSQILITIAASLIVVTVAFMNYRFHLAFDDLILLSSSLFGGFFSGMAFLGYGFEWSLLAAGAINTFGLFAYLSMYNKLTRFISVFSVFIWVFSGWGLFCMYV